MLLDLDTTIFVGFLVINLTIGLYYSRKTKNITEYSIGTGFRTSAITSTIIATFIGAGFFSAALTESYRQGLSFIIPALGEPLAFVIMGMFLVPRIVGFFNSLSVAETMGNFYGKHVRIITAIVGILICTAGVSMQFKVATSIMQLFFGLSSFYLSILLGAIVIIYSSLGGIKAVTFTDILQFLTFGCVLPIIFLTIWRTSNIDDVYYTLSTSPLFDYKELLNINHPKFLSLISLFAFFIIPTCEPAYIQRISMSKGPIQAKRSYIIAGCLSMIMLLIVCSTSVLLLSQNPNLDPHQLLPHIINNYTYPGLKGLACVGIMAIVMSTADSAINTASVLFLHDIIGISNSTITDRRKLIFLRVFASILGIVALVLAYRASSFLEILGMIGGLYMPIVIVPLIFAICGFSSSPKVALIGMLAGALTVTLWSNFANSPTILGFQEEVPEEVNAIVPGILANMAAFIIAHYASGRPKGFVLVEHENALRALDHKRRQALLRFFRAITNFNLMTFCKNNLPKQEVQETFYLILGLFSFLSIVSLTYSLTPEVYVINSSLLDIIHLGILIFSSILITYPIWIPSLKSEKFIAIFWTIAVAIILVFVPTLFVIVSEFNQLQLIVLLINMMILAFLVKWQIALMMFTIASYASIKSYELFMESYVESSQYSKIIYILLFISAVLIAFLRPKQEAQDLSEEMVEYLGHTVEDQNNQIFKLSTLKQTFLRNLQHETSTPITGVYSMSQALGDCYDKLTDEQRKNAIATITTSSERLISYASNLVDISKLTSSSYNLKMREVNLSNMLEEVIRKCKKLYIAKGTEDDREITVEIEPDLTSICDEYYIRKSFENLIINAIQYCKKGRIEISITEEKEAIKLTVRDSGIGIPQDELSVIFEPFVTSSKTLTPAGGRGVGLTMVKSAVETHKGTVTVSSDGEAGSVFTLSLPKIVMNG